MIRTDDAADLFYSTVGDGDHVVVVPGGFYLTELEEIAHGRTFVLLHQRRRG